MMLKKIVDHFVFLLVGLSSLGIAIFISTIFLTPSYSQDELEMPPPPPEFEQDFSDAEEMPPPPASLDAPPLDDGELPPPPLMDEVADLPPASTDDIDMDSAESQETFAEIDEVMSLLEPFDYDSGDRRDPFKPYIVVVEQNDVKGEDKFKEPKGPLLPLQRFDLNELRLTGIIWGVDKPQAMFLDPSGKTYRVAINARIGRNGGYVAVIREGQVVVVESVRVRGEVVFNTKIITLEE